MRVFRIRSLSLQIKIRISLESTIRTNGRHSSAYLNSPEEFCFHIYFSRLYPSFFFHFDRGNAELALDLEGADHIDACALRP